jgi:hypothetical protein
MPTTVRSASCARWSATSRSCSPRRTSRTSENPGTGQRSRGAGLREHAGGPIRLGGAPVWRGTARQWPDSDPGAHRGPRNRPRRGNGRSMKIGLFRERGDRPGVLGRRERPGDRRDDGATGARTDAITGATGGMTAATGVADPDCFADSSKTRSVWMGSAECVDPLDDRVDPPTRDAHRSGSRESRRRARSLSLRCISTGCNRNAIQALSGNSDLHARSLDQSP